MRGPSRASCIATRSTSTPRSAAASTRTFSATRRPSFGVWPTRPGCRLRIRPGCGRSAARLVESVRRERAAKSGLDAFLRKYDLSSQEGVILMCLAEALLRIPDDDTADRLIADKIRAGDWESHLGDSESLFVNASTWGLMLTGRMVSLDDSERGAPEWLRLAARHPDRRAHGAWCDAPGNAHHGSPVRHGPDHRRGARAIAQGRERALPVLVRHAGRGGAHRAGRRALPGGLPRGDRDRADALSRRALPMRGGRQHLGQAVRTASTLRAQQPR